MTGESLPIDKGPGDPVFTGTSTSSASIEVDAEKVGDETTFGQVLRWSPRRSAARRSWRRLADRLARYFLPVVELVAGATLLDRLSRRLARRLVADGGRAGGRLPVRAGAGDPGGDARQHGLAGAARRADQGRLGAREPGGVRHVRLRQDRDADQGTAAVHQPGRRSAARRRGRRVCAWRPRPRRPAATRWPRPSSRRPGADRSSCSSRATPPCFPARASGRDASRRTRQSRTVLVGNRRLLAEPGSTLDPAAEAILGELDARGETALIVAVDGAMAGVIGVHDAIRPEAHDVIHDLRHLKIKEIAILTGDREPAARAVAKRVHADTVQAELLPADKARWIEERRRAGRRVAMVGDGINDAPALAQADAGIALGGIGADLAAEAGDLIVLGDPLRVLPDLLGLSRSTVAIIRQNIIGFAFGFNAVAMLSATFGILGPVAAAILHQVGSLLVLLNSMRLLVFGDWAELPPFRSSARARLPGSAGSTIDSTSSGLATGSGAAGGSIRRLRVVHSAGRATPRAAGRRSGRTRSACSSGSAGIAASLEPGLHLRWPYPIERVTTSRPTGSAAWRSASARPASTAGEPLRWEATHGRPRRAMRRGRRRCCSPATAATSSWRRRSSSRSTAADPESVRRFVFDVADGEAALRPLAESAVREVVGRRPLLDLLTSGRREAEVAAASCSRSGWPPIDSASLVRGIAFQDIHPPLAVVDAYRDVSRATSDRQRRINEARRLPRPGRDRGAAASPRRCCTPPRPTESARLALAAGDADTLRLAARGAAVRSGAHRFPALLDRRSPRPWPASPSSSSTRSRAGAAT